MKVCLCLAVLLASALSSPTGDVRIIGGKEAVQHSHPWQASLQSNGRHICGASVIKENWLVTASHCVDGSTAGLSVVVAEHDISTNRDSAVTHQLSRVIMHPEYNSGRGTYPNDIALLKVSSPIALTSKASTIKLATSSMDFVGRNCKISGWGLKDSGSNLVDTEILLELQVDAMTHSDCRSAWGYFSIINSHICVSNANRNSDVGGACNGDSGGPLSCEVNGEMYLAGATSWGYNGCRQEGYPSVYTRISSFKSWIDEVTATY